MQILILGATGRTGSLVLLEALRRGHSVTALVRTPPALDTVTSALPDAQKANLTVVRGSPLDTSDVSNAVNTASKANTQLVVISALNSRRTSESPWAPPHPTDSPPRMMADSVANVLSALKSQAESAGAFPKPKVIHVSAIGVGVSTANAPWLLRTLISRTNVKLTYDDHAAVEDELKAAGEGVGWVVLRPARLTDDVGSSPRVWSAEKGSIGMLGKCSRGAVAKFALDAAEGSEWDGKDPIILS
ncbi:NAD-dependent epimerase/dehydratase-like protein [Lasiosphaeria miniovina]|uniref:NAD-dependent epimerase/dehydratase-like protein n=1 Tax=Lasiosphaeria miniovina TaxID=1954250 RepID=A0AA40B6S6_9PEZI|nr:NAD-dependent epimerase/dehydratase-like protein [Lasiosphaeria miniovina]KAK0728740.1 NAD-dependent epimerase/dehydratase-like protein [Lasiosphaeria miniovina]